MFQIVLETENAWGKILKSRINLCDLAGSEKIYLEEWLGEQHLEEHKSINLSLSTLGKVVSALSKNQQVIPYWESKLTWLLKDSLGGHTTTILIATVNPLNSTIEETISTLKFADRASKIKVYSKANEFDAKDDALVKWLRWEVLHLKDILLMRNHGTKNDINQEILHLKEENH